ncbi:MAG: C39 family peptidase [Clostridiales bacterium]|nr:C39 family peptidase [Clostridiales bacterium]
MKRLFFLFTFISLFLSSMPIYAFEHGYETDSDLIYALARNDLAIYDSTDGDFRTYLSAFSGVVVVGSSGSWYEVKYEGDSGTRYGWVTKDDFSSDCLIYDGTEKQILANGTYYFRFYDLDNESEASLSSIEPTDIWANISLTCQITFLGDDTFQICRRDTGQYLMSDGLFRSDSSTSLWGSPSKAGTVRFIRKGNYYGIQDTSTNRYLGQNSAGLLAFTNQKEYAWRLNRTRKAIGSSNLRVFVQFDADWADVYYGSGKNPDPSTNNFCTSACGIFATMNAIYSLTGQYADPIKLADYAVQNHYRIEDNGTDSSYFKAAAKKFGYKYGFEYDGSGDSFTQLKEKLAAGDTVITYVPGHYAAIVDYDEKTKKYLFLDSHYLAKRGTSSFGDWVTEEDLTSGSLYAQMFYYYKAIDY